MLSLESFLFSSLHRSLIGFSFGFDLSTGLLDPFVTVNATRVVLNRFVDVVFRFTVELRQLCEGEDAQCVEFLFTVWTDALDGLEVILVLLGGGSNAVEINVLLSLLDAVDGLLLLRFTLDFIRFDCDAPKEVHACLSKFETTLIGAAFIAWECTVIELEVDDNLSILTNGEFPSAFFCEGSFKHLESSVVVEFVVVLHFDPDITHAGDGDFLHARMNGARLDVFKWGEDERIVLSTCTCNECRLCAGVFRFWAICKEHKNLILTKEHYNKQNQEQKQKAWETPHPVDCIIVIGFSIAADTSADCAFDGFWAGGVVIGVRATSCFFIIRVAVVIVVRVSGEVAEVIVRQHIREAVIVGVVEHSKGEVKRLAVGRVVGPNGQVDRFRSVDWRSTQSSIKQCSTCFTDAKRQSIRQFPFNFPCANFAHAGDVRHQRVHGLVNKQVNVLSWV